MTNKCHRTALVAAIQIALSFLMPAVHGHAADWKTETVEGSGGKYSSMRIDTYGNAHIAHFNEADNLLMYSFWDARLKRWFTTPLDRGSCPHLVLDSAQRPALSYLEYGTGRVKYARWDGTTWIKQAIPVQARVISYYNSIALDRHDTPRIVFYEEFSTGIEKTRLRTVLWNGSAWELRTIDADEGSGKFNSAVNDSRGYTHVAYGNVAYQNASLRYAHWDGASWQVEILEGEGRPGTSMWSVYLTLDDKDTPHIVYTDVVNRIVKYATKQNGKWVFEKVDTIAKVAYPDRNGIALDRNRQPYLSYFDAGAGTLRVAYKQGGRWVAEIVDTGSAGYTSSLQITADGTLWVSYCDERNGQLRVARRTLGPATTSNAAEPPAPQTKAVIEN